MIPIKKGPQPVSPLAEAHHLRGHAEMIPIKKGPQPVSAEALNAGKAMRWRGRLGRGINQVSTPQPFIPLVSKVESLLPGRGKRHRKSRPEYHCKRTEQLVSGHP